MTFLKTMFSNMLSENFFKLNTLSAKFVQSPGQSCRSFDHKCSLSKHEENIDQIFFCLTEHNFSINYSKRRFTFLCLCSLPVKEQCCKIFGLFFQHSILSGPLNLQSVSWNFLLFFFTNQLWWIKPFCSWFIGKANIYRT